MQLPVTATKSDSHAPIAEVRQGLTCTKFIFSCARSCEVRLGLMLIALTQQKIANFLWAEPKPLEIQNFILNPKIAVWPPEVESFSFYVFQKFH